jgi:hypothetical protein
MARNHSAINSGITATTSGNKQRPGAFKFREKDGGEWLTEPAARSLKRPT